MNQNSDIINDFEDLLKNRSSKKTSALYTCSERKNDSPNTSKIIKLCSAKEVLASVAKQLKAIQNADTASHKHIGSKLDEYKKKEFLTVDMIPIQTKVPQNIPTKFETQCVTDTQLIDVIENVEILDRHGGITQEFDKTFCQKSDESDHDVKVDEGSLNTDEKIDNFTDIIKDSNVDIRDTNDLKDQESNFFENSNLITCDMKTITCQNSIVTDDDEINQSRSLDNEGYNICAEILDESKDDTDRITSPVLATKRRKSTPPLVVSLYAFEHFENLAHPIIEEHEDLEVAKNLINSQIFGREIYIPDHFYDSIARTSPVFDKIECITTNINKDILNKRYTCSNKYLDEDVNNINESRHEVKSCTEMHNIIRENEKTQVNIRKVEIKDEIIFSSDEEYEYLHKDVQELPLTCALETSFYDRSDVLDKTMYVGFQTASNKSIQIQTDSFHKAKSILSNINNKGTETTLTDLVKIFDSGSRVVSENLKNDSHNNDLGNKTSFEIMHKNIGNLTTSQNEGKIDDTLQNACLTELEQDNERNDDIVMSQIIEFKSISKSTKSNNIKTPQEIINDTFDSVAFTALEHDIDDVPMSQIIEFKSNTRSQKHIENSLNTSANDTFACPTEVAKRRFEGFKTASNKKIKLSDKALARCKKVFQDIDLDDSEDINCISNHECADSGVYEDLKWCVPIPGEDHAGSKLSHGKELENDMAYDISRLSNFVNAKTNGETNARHNNTNLNVKKSTMEDVDLQINDQILREFEDNDMPFGETNDNSVVGFKTASNKNIVISDNALINSKHLFQDIMTIKEENKCDAVTKISNDDREHYQNISEKPTVDFKTVTYQQITSSNVALMEVNGTMHNIVSQKEKENNEENHNNESSTSDFVHFKTAANKEILISENAIERSLGFSKSLDSELPMNIDDCKHVLANTEMKNMNFVGNEFTKCGIDTQDFFGEELTRIEDFMKDNEMKNENLGSDIFKGFETASKKAIVVSEKGIEKSKKLFEEFNKDWDAEIQIKDVTYKQKYDNKGRIHSQKTDSTYLGNDDNGFETEFKGCVENTCKDVTPEKRIDALDFKDINTEAPKFVGFRTASAKPIRISAAAIEKTKRMLSELEVDEMMVEYEQPLNPQPSQFVGFKTASNRQVKISGKALAKSKQLLKDFELKDDIDKADCDTRQIKRINNVNNNPCFLSKCIGFQTASDKTDKEVKISSEALARSKEIFQDVDIFEKEGDMASHNLEKAKNSNKLKSFQKASNKKITFSAKALEESRELFQEIDNNDHQQESHTKDHKQEKQDSSAVFKGFQTASNKEVKISAEALARSKKIFQDIVVSEKESGTISDMIEQKEKPNKFKGFQTANNKTVGISERALEKSRELFNAIDGSDLKQDLPGFGGFQTASNKAVIISNEALASSKKIFQDVDIFGEECETFSENVKQIETGKLFRGFQSANNKKVNISETALENSRKLLNFETNDFKEENSGDGLVFRGFQTASNKRVKISKEALARSKKIFQDVDVFENESVTVSDKVQQAQTENVFRGFQTANNEKVNISEKAIQNSRKLFDDIDCNELKEHKNECATFRGFQTASNKKVKISDDALAKSKKLFEDVNLSQVDINIKPTVDLNTGVNNYKKSFDEDNLQTVSKNNVKVHKQKSTREILKNVKEIIEFQKRDDSNVTLRHSTYKNINGIDNKIDAKSFIDKDVIDTQVLNDFQDTLNTEDFAKNSPKSKRSGSPILSCPRAKKRKFETPYRSHKQTEPKSVFVAPKLAKTHNFDDEYKKNKKYTLKDIESLEKEHNKNKTKVDPYIFQFNFDTLLNFEFSNTRNDYTDGILTIDDLKKIFLGSVNKKIVPDGWLVNHIKLITWKLLSYEIKYPNVMKNICTVRNVLEQLKYRYDRELYNVQRPILRKVLEKDEVSSKTMVLCVAGIYVENVSVTSVNPSSQNVELLLTDGWYCVKTCTDRMIVRLLAKGAIVVGTKIAVCGAELANCEQGISPWEDTSTVRLKLSGNSTALCRWHARLGLRPPLRRPLGAVSADGGRVAAVRVRVVRVYPPLYVEKMDDGSTVTLSERLEHIRQMKYETEREVVMEKLYEEVEREMSDLDSQDSEGLSNDRVCLDSGSQISKCMNRSKDPDEYRSHLTKSQNRMLEDYGSKQREKLIEKVRAKFQEKLEKNGLKTDRNVIPLLKVRVVGFKEKEGVEITKGYLSIWKPSAALLELVTEGAWIEILNVIPTGIRNSEIQLSAGRQTVFNSYKQTNEKYNLYANTLKRKCYEIKEITQNPTMTTDYNEIDIVGMIFCIEPSTKELDEKQRFQNVYLADADKNMVCVNFWGGLKKFGFENILDTGQIITCVNLQKRAGNTRKSIPHYRVTEFSYFTKTPKDKNAVELTNELTNKLSKVKDKFCQDCMLLKDNYSVLNMRNNENVSPYRFNYNVSKNTVSPLRKCDANLNLTGLDFESNFDSQEISPQMLLRKKKTNEKIEKIRLNYGEPPPLATIHIINKSKNASATYKSPLISKLERSSNNLVNAETPGLQNDGSSLSMNRTYVKNVNPIKLNFSSANLDNSVDHFAEDFEASPPLSLDSDVVN